jgi:NADH-quinone oxidoreductase subunit L
MKDYLFLIPLFPAIGFLFNIFFGKKLSEKTISVTGVLPIAFSFLLSLLTAYEFLTSGHNVIHQEVFRWIDVGELKVKFGFLIDPLSLVMILVVTFDALLIHIYSIGYMHGDRRYGAYFSYLNLFVAMMLVLVMGDSILLSFLGWEGVGLCSYLLIGFWFEEEERARAGMKAFIVNRIGDFGFVVGIVLILMFVGGVSYEFMVEGVKNVSHSILVAIGLCLFCGAVGKSAQVPLYVWLPDAMAGPTPVSALIHAATMVTAGVYMVARMHFLYSLIPEVLLVISWVGGFTAVFAASMGITATGIKKVLAYSTISQLGYMFMGVGTGIYWVGIYHLATHAFFKALLFLGAGSVIHGLHGEEDIMKMGGLRRYMGWTYGVFLVGCLAIAGVPPFSGFWSKDAILLAVLQERGAGLFAVGVFGAFMTAFYMFRLLYLVFHGEERFEKKPHESGPVMIIPLVILAFMSVIGGNIGIERVLEEFFGGHFHHDERAMVLSVLSGLTGIGLATYLYIINPSAPKKISQKLINLYTLLYNKYYVDEIYDFFIVKPLVLISTYFFKNVTDETCIDGTLHWTARIMDFSGRVLKVVQGREFGRYAFFMVLAITILYFLLR